MTAQDLKNAILQLAVQGKLVPQDPNDEPASELLKRIKAEKERLIRDGKVTIDKKHTPMPITEDDITYDLPDNWCWVKFADIVSFYSGQTPERHTAAYWEKGEYAWVSIGDMVPNGITVNTKENITRAAFIDCFSEKISPAGTMIMSFKLTIGKISILGVDAVHNEAIISIFPFIEDRSLKEYLFKVLPLVASSGNFKNAIKGKTLNATSLSNLMVPLPPLAEPQRIVAKIEELLPLVEEYGKAEERLTALNAEFPDKLRKSILQQAIQGKLTERDPSDEPASELLKRIRAEKERLVKEGKIKKEKPLPPITEEEIPFEIPDNWEWAHIGELFQHNTGKALNASDTEGDYHPYITTSNLYWNCFKLDSIKKMLFTIDEIEKCSIKKGDLLVCEGGDFGRSAIWNYDIPMCIQNHIHRLRSFVSINTEFYYYVFWFYKNSGFINGKGIGIKGLSSNVLHALIVPLPPLAEQQRIVDRVNELLAVCDKLK